jgi:hypothetical protein
MPYRIGLPCQRCQTGLCLARSVVGVLQGPLLGLLDCGLLISFPGIGDLLIQRIIQIWQGHQGLNRKQHRSDLQRRRPLVLEDVEANSAKLVDVGVVDLGSEKDLGWHHWVLFRQEELAVENSTLVWSLSWASNLDKEMSWVLLVWLSVNADNWILGKSLGFLQISVN